MRIISGKVRGLKLNSPKDDKVRPTTDRVKESMFNIISSYVMDAEVLDLFAGSGALGIECISRGAKKCVFVDNSKDSIQTIKTNIDKSKLNNESDIIQKDYKDAMKYLSNKNMKFDIIFLDPPYYEDLFESSIKNISLNNLLNDDGIVVVEHDYGIKISDKVENLEKDKEKKYGKIALSFYKKVKNNE